MSSSLDQDGSFFYVQPDALKVIFVDDDPILREFAVVNLTTEETTVAAAADGATALKVVDGLEPDIMVLDLDMPGMDGVAVLETLRASGRDLPVVVIVGREDVEAIDRAFQAGADGFAVKPLNWRLLAQQLRFVRRAHGAARRPEPGEAERQLQRLAAESSTFLRAALARDPSLRPLAADFARIADEVLSALIPGAEAA
ncbi:MAG TPA: response regulator [Caulobacteraceae bacterium]|nr:response regulator [Caulobacteraceae bacterium]